MKQLSKAKWIRLACFSAGGTLLFYLVPLILMQLPDPAKGNAMVILVMFVNQVFMGVVGWHSNYFGKWGIYIPMVLIVLYGISLSFLSFAMMHPVLILSAFNPIA